MAKKATAEAPTATAPAKAPAPAKAAATPQPIQKSIPAQPARGAEAAAPRKLPVTHEMVAERAYFLSQSGAGGEWDCWLQAERELSGDGAAA